jgi:hypothetical protein
MGQQQQPTETLFPAAREYRDSTQKNCDGQGNSAELQKADGRNALQEILLAMSH